MLQLISIHSLIVVVGLLVYVLTSHAMQQRHSPTAAVSWVLTIALMPYVGLPLYLMFGTRKRVRKEWHAAHAAPVSDLLPDDAWCRRLANSMGQPPAVGYRQLRIHRDGHEALESLWKVIDSAEHELVLCTFILGRDPMGRALMQRLIAKAHAGVRIRLLLDAFGRLLGGGPNLRQLHAAGIEVTLFGPFMRPPFKTRANLRNHRKMAVADGTRLWCGGRNFATEYFEGKHGHPPWRDASFDLEGPLAAQALDLFERDWAYANDAPVPPARRPAPVPGEALAQVIASGPDQADDTVHDMLVSACFRARSRILAVTPYFVPTDALLSALSLAARRDVTVDLVLPRHSNHRMADFARHRALRTLAGAGGRIWQVPYMIHAKAVVFDDELALAGSANLDSRSLLLNYELMTAFYAPPDVERFAGFIDEHRKCGARYQARKPGLLRDFAEGLVLLLAFQL